MTVRLRLFAAVLPLVALAACGGAPSPAGRPAASQAGATPTPWHFDGDPAPGEATAALHVPGPVDGPARLKGLSGIQVRSVLGSPGFRRRDAPAEIWQYRSRACTLDLFLYDEGNGSQTVSHYAVRSPSGLDDRSCFDELTAGNRGTPTS